jgi:hypothetical protein
MKKIDKLLTAVVPISGMADNLQYIKAWLPLVNNTPLSVILVHDINDQLTSGQLHELVADTNSLSIKLLEGHFGGPGSARNFGLEQVVTEWVTFWDSDDIPHVSVFFETISKAALTTQVIINNFEVLDISTNQTTQARIPIDMVDLGCQVGIWRFTFRTNYARRSKFGSFRMGEDQIFLARLPCFEDQMEIVDDTSYTYIRGHKLQLTQDSARIYWLNSTIAELINDNVLLKSKNTLALTIGIRLTLTLIKSRNPLIAFRGIKYLSGILMKSDFGPIQTLDLFSKVAKRAVKNV